MLKDKTNNRCRHTNTYKQLICAYIFNVYICCS